MQTENVFVNRELSWIEFNERVLGEAKDTSNLLFERLKFLGITASNLDEFFMVRVASLKDMQHAGYKKRDIAGLTVDEQLALICERAHRFIDSQYDVYNEYLIPELNLSGLKIIDDYTRLSEKQKRYIDRYFEDNIYPVLTPMAVDSSRPFPLIRNKSLNIAALLRKKNSHYSDTAFATVQVPGGLPRFVKIPSADGTDSVMLLENIIMKNMGELFSNYDITCACPYRVMRNADLSIDEDEASDLLKEIEKQLKRRLWGQAIRLEVKKNVDGELLDLLKSELNVSDSDIYKVDGPLDLTFLNKIYSSFDYSAYKNKAHVPAPAAAFLNDDDIFTNVRKGDILLCHPYESFDPVVDFVMSAAKDENVLAIKQTLYRVSGNSPIVEALSLAAENGKQVTVLVELKARFDEENNIIWAKKLEQSGCHVIYGLVGLKTHSKITLVVRKEEDGIRRYVHLGTGNYNDSTARLYTDMGLFTCSPLIGEDATAVFNMLSGFSEPKHWNKLSLAPLWLRDKINFLIDREIMHAKSGKDAHIIIKVNSLCDKEVITKLYEASGAGVKTELIVRGICCLVPGVPGMSENITVRSIVGNFLEHSRIFCFENGGNKEMYMGSADLMGRNLDRRVEILFPVEEPALIERLSHILEVLLSDNTKARIMDSHGNYSKIRCHGEKNVNAQAIFVEEAKAGAQLNKRTENDGRIFIPFKPHDR